MEWIIFSEKDIDDYKTFINGDAYSGIWHSVEWLDFQLKTLKAVNGFFFGVKDENEIVLAGLFLIQKSKKFKFGYIPAGFLYKKINAEILNFFFNNINNLAKKENLLFTQVDSITPFDGNLDILLKNEKRVKTGLKLPIPQFTNTIDLSLSYDDILAAMKPKGRYNIKLAEKKGVRIKKGSISEISEFYKLLKETTERDGFRPNNEEYYRKMVEIIPNSQLLVAYHEEDILASGIFTYFNNQGLYYYGASSNVKRNLMAPYLLQWEAIKIAKENKNSYFDFMGIADPDDPNDRLLGVTDFKLKFSENIIKFNSPFHVIHKKINYDLFNFLKSLRKIAFQSFR